MKLEVGSDWLKQSGINNIIFSNIYDADGDLDAFPADIRYNYKFNSYVYYVLLVKVTLYSTEISGLN